MKRVVVFKNGCTENGKVILLSHSIQDLLTLASSKLGINARRIYTRHGGEVDDAAVIRDDDILYISSGEPFSAPDDGLTHALSSRCQVAPITMTHDWVTLNVGGQYFTTTRSTLLTKEPNSMLARMFSNDTGMSLVPSCLDNSGAYLIDRSPAYFEPILNFLRHGELILDSNVNPQGVLEEAKFFGIESIIPELEDVIKEDEASNDNKALTRRDVINALICTSHSAELRFQGVNLGGADLSRLDLRFINFKYANLQKCNLSGTNLCYCCLERADLSHSNMEGANLLAVKMLCANLEGANLKSCNFEDPAGSHAIMEGVNLKGANLEGSHMASVNLRVATLKNANLQNCDLRGAVLAGADLENCDLSGSDLHEANLRGANLKDAAFELMLTPLHMSQTMFNTIR